MIFEAMKANIGWQLGQLAALGITLIALALMAMVWIVSIEIRIKLFGWEWYHSAPFRGGYTVLVSPKDQRHSRNRRS